VLQPSHLSKQVTRELVDQEVTIAGFIEYNRVTKNLIFLGVRDPYGLRQAIIKRKENEESYEALKDIPPQSSIAIKGIVSIEDSEEGKKLRGGVEIQAKEIEILAKSEVPLPFDPTTDFINTDRSTRFDWRILDLRNPKSLAYHKLRSAVIFAITEYMNQDGFVYWTTPKVLGQSSEGGSEVFKVDWFGKEAFLAMSPQLHKQALAGNTGTKFFEITPYFRAEKSRTRRHLAEFTGIDVEMPFVTEESVWTVAENIVKIAADTLIKHSEELELIGVDVKPVKTPFKRISYDEAVDMLNKSGIEEIKMSWGEDFSTEQERVLADIIDEPFFVYQFPKSVAKFYVRTVLGEPTKAHAFDLIYKHELCSGAWRESRYDELIKNLKEKELEPDNFKAYLDFFRYGCAPHSGFGMGIERLLVTLLGAPDVQEVVAFPRTYDRLAP
jgi:nondiscriminating aspartyl-tRNA synthetase